MEVKVIDERSLADAAEADYVRVLVSPDPEQDTMTLATIERVVCKASVKPTSPATRIKRLIERQPMTRDAALFFAKLYAARKRIGLVLTSED
jgi:hypothetical protein